MSRIPFEGTTERAPNAHASAPAAPADIVGSVFRERRATPRHATTGCATGVVSDAHDPARPKRICALKLLNLSSRGLGAVSSTPLPIGGQIALYVSPHRPGPGTDLRGTVVRCQQRAGGYDVGIALSQPQRAA